METASAGEGLACLQGAGRFDRESGVIAAPDPIEAVQQIWSAVHGAVSPPPEPPAAAGTSVPVTVPPEESLATSEVPREDTATLPQNKIRMTTAL